MTSITEYYKASQTEEQMPLHSIGEDDKLDEELISPWNTKHTWQPIASDSHNFIGALEGLRGVAVSLVLYCHTFGSDSTHLLSNVLGSTGVSIFFVLSGFLITGILIRLNDHSTKQKGKIFNGAALRRFYMDRFVRLSPSLTFVILTMIGLYYARGNVKLVLKPALLAITYTTNIQSFWSAGDNSSIFFNTWSLAIEEQYYLLWSLSVPLILRLSTRGRIITLFSLISISYILFILAGIKEGFFFDYYTSLPTNVYKMLIGSSLRLLPLPPLFRKPIFTYIGLFGIGTMIYSVWGPHHFQIYDYFQNSRAAVLAWTDPVTAAMTVLIICGLHGTNSNNYILDNRILRFLGKISYAVYLLQWSIMMYYMSGSSSWNASGVVALSILGGQFCTFVIEDPIRAKYGEWKKRLAGIIN